MSEPTPAEPTPFGPEVVTAIMAHMNGDHLDDNVVIVRALSAFPDASAAVMTGLDADAIEFAVTDPAGERTVRLPFSRRLTERGEVRAEVVRMFTEAGGSH
jgi:putative heme iron utilization protein